MNFDFLDDLNSEQRDAVEYCDGPSLVIAGAGSGKTRVLTYKIAYLLMRGLRPYNILALTFTNKAAREMKERIAGLVGDDTARYLNMGTFHSVFARILRAEAEKIGFTSTFTIYDQSDSQSLIKTIIKDMNLDEKMYKASAVHGRISMAKNQLVLPAQYGAVMGVNRQMPGVSNIYAEYQSRCRKANAMDFDDLLVYTYILFKENEEICRKYAERFRFILVDEYQDTNKVQQMIIDMITFFHHNICVVGDDAQSIYSFRGARIDNILNFSKNYPDVRTFKLERNYRSTKCIVQAANSLIRHNRNRIEKDVYSEKENGEKIIYRSLFTDREEASVVASDIEAYRRKLKIDYDGIAILYRTNAQSRSFEDALRQRRIPYKIYGGLSFYQRKEIKNMTAYFRMVTNPGDEEAFKRVINYPARGIGATTLAKISIAAREKNCSMWDVVCNPDECGLDVTKGVITKLNKFTELISGFIEKVNSLDAFTLGKMIATESGVESDIRSDKSVEGLSRQENIEEFFSALKAFVDENTEAGREGHVFMNDFLQEVSLLTTVDESDSADQGPAVTLMTAHSAKGLEFPVVFIVGMEEGIFPNVMCSDSLAAIEEERRLFYVALTRAEKVCVITSAEKRYRFGQLEFQTPSKFIGEIDPSLVRRVESSFSSSFDSSSSYGSAHSSFSGKPFHSRFEDSYSSRVESWSNSPSYSDTSVKKTVRVEVPDEKIIRRIKHEVSTPDSSIEYSQQYDLRVGDRISHSRFGNGSVVSMTGTGDNLKAMVDFENEGKKLLLLKFAKFEKL